MLALLIQKPPAKSVYITYVDFTIYYYWGVIILCPCHYRQQKPSNAVYQDTVKEKVNNIQNVAESSKTSASCTQIFQCQEPTHRPTARPGFTTAMRTLMDHIYKRKRGLSR